MNPENIQKITNDILTSLFDIDYTINPSHVSVEKEDFEEKMAAVHYVLIRLHHMHINFVASKETTKDKKNYIKKTVKIFRATLTSMLDSNV